MTEWRDSSAFFFSPTSEDDSTWLREIINSHEAFTVGEDFREGLEYIPCYWGGLSSRAQVLSSAISRTLVISYPSSDFALEISASPARRLNFRNAFIETCTALSPEAAVAFGAPSDDVFSDARRYEPSVWAEDGPWLRAQTYELLYLCPDLDAAAQTEFPSSEFPGQVLSNGGRVTDGRTYRDSAR